MRRSTRFERSPRIIINGRSHTRENGDDDLGHRQDSSLESIVDRDREIRIAVRNLGLTTMREEDKLMIKRSGIHRRRRRRSSDSPSGSGSHHQDEDDDHQPGSRSIGTESEKMIVELPIKTDSHLNLTSTTTTFHQHPSPLPIPPASSSSIPSIEIQTTPPSSSIIDHPIILFDLKFYLYSSHS